MHFHLLNVIFLKFVFYKAHNFCKKFKVVLNIYVSFISAEWTLRILTHATSSSTPLTFWKRLLPNERCLLLQGIINSSVIPMRKHTSALHPCWWVVNCCTSILGTQSIVHYTTRTVLTHSIPIYLQLSTSAPDNSIC